VSSAYVVRNTQELAALARRVQQARLRLREAEHAWAKGGCTPRARAEVRLREAKLSTAERRMCEARRAFLAAVDDEESRGAPLEAEPALSSSGFVTFARRQDALASFGARDAGVNVRGLDIAQAPGPDDVIYADLRSDAHKNRPWKVAAGYVLLVAVFLFYFPLVLLVMPMATLSRMESYAPAMASTIRSVSMVAHVWDGVMDSFLLNILMSFLPACVMFIIRRFLCLASHSRQQHALQRWYYWFLVLFVLLVHAIGASLLGTGLVLLRDPLSFFPLLGDSLPKVCHFYLNFLAAQWAVQSMEAMRIPNLLKFLYYRRRYGEHVAREQAEPEDQDYDGIGARSARLTLLLVTALVFGTLQPLVCVVALATFAVARANYGYLLVFAETRKPDAGGACWCAQLLHVLEGLLVYTALMLGMARRHLGPSLLIGGAFVLAAVHVLRFRWGLRRLGRLPEHPEEPGPAARRAGAHYVQPELAEPPARAGPPKRAAHKG